MDQEGEDEGGVEKERGRGKEKGRKGREGGEGG